MRVTSGKSRVRESRKPGSVRAKPNGRATRPAPRTDPGVEKLAGVVSDAELEASSAGTEPGYDDAVR